MSKPVISIHGIGKKYRLDTVIRHDMLRDQIANAFKSLFRRNGNKTGTDPNKAGDRIIGEKEFWALKDVSFDVQQGEVIGIIGRNGAGKSTLLKILSEITEPTTGEIRIRGRVGSLLEVGTGFHPELTGRENIYMNGAILGMTKAEIKAKFAEIVDFAEIESFLDTPVKRYSSGMHVRLAFAVAAHLNPEILFIDEVLSVGDESFQKKCLGKMEGVANEGRTILLVSHNMNTIQRMCNRSIMLNRGKIVNSGNTNNVIAQYLSDVVVIASPQSWIDLAKRQHLGQGEAIFNSVWFSSLNKSLNYYPYSYGKLLVRVTLTSDVYRSVKSFAVILFDKNGNKLINADTLEIGKLVHIKKGLNIINLLIEKLYLKPDKYILGLWIADYDGKQLDFIKNAIRIEVIDNKIQKYGAKPLKDGSVVCNFNIVDIQNISLSYDDLHLNL